MPTLLEIFKDELKDVPNVLNKPTPTQMEEPTGNPMTIGF
tara:strand:- start:191 stop:310 length:120 start_codon:yes stop_codon:yes gene_type:complete